MRKFRRIKKAPRPQGYIIALCSAILAIPFRVVFLRFYSSLSQYSLLSKLENYYSEVSTVTLLLVISVYILAIGLFLKREKISTLELEPMSKEAKKLAKKIKRLFKDQKIIEVLKFSVPTSRGEEMPNIEVYVDEDLLSGFVAIENIANFEKMDKDKYQQKISGLFSGKFQRFSIVSSELSSGDSYMIFYFEDTSTSKRLKLSESSDFSEFISENITHIRLSQDLVWNTEIAPHLTIIARTRAGKTIFSALYLAKLMELQGWNVEYNSAKEDIFIKEFNGVYRPIDIVERAEYWCQVMDERLKAIKEENKQKASEIGLSPIAIFFDELGNLNAGIESEDKLDKTLKLSSRWTNAINRLTASGASAGIHIIAISQYATKEGFLPTLAKVNCSDAVIMLGGAADSAEERKYLIPGFTDLPKRNYGVGQGIAKINGAGKKWEKPHFFETPWIKGL